MSRRIYLVAIIMMTMQLSCAQLTHPDQTHSDQQAFEKLLATLARGWNTNDAALAASVFAEDAIYAEPPDKQLYSGRDAIFAFFGGAAGRTSWMKME